MNKEWSWSYSKKKNYDTCPKRHYEVDIQRNFTEETEQLKWGNEVHNALAVACRDKTPLPNTMTVYQKWVDDTVARPGQLLVEQKFAIGRDFSPQPYFGPMVWYRGICDVAVMNGDHALARDWKTGKIKHDSTQLMLMATCLFVHHPQLQTIDTEFVWLQEGVPTKDTWTRDKLRGELAHLLPEVDAMEIASKAMNVPPKPSGLCRSYCPVSSCPFYKKGPNK
jgi:hypothetical protein